MSFYVETLWFYEARVWMSLFPLVLKVALLTRDQLDPLQFAYQTGKGGKTQSCLF